MIPDFNQPEAISLVTADIIALETVESLYQSAAFANYAVFRGIKKVKIGIVGLVNLV